MRRFLVFVAFNFVLLPCISFAETKINLLGSISGGVEIFNVRGCKNTPSDREATAKILSFHQDTGTTVLIDGQRYYVPGNQVSFTYK